MSTNKKKLLLSESLAPEARALLDARDDIEQVYFPHMLPNDEFLALVKKEAPVSGWTLGATRINADVIDAVGELTNMIAGGAKAQLERFEMNLSIPNVITGKGHTVEFPRDATPVCIPFDCPWGLITVEFGLVEQAVAAMS